MNKQRASRLRGCRYTAPKSQGKVAIERQATAPSVPGKTQVYGYEEDEHGVLVMQPSPVEGHAGVPPPQQKCRVA